MFDNATVKAAANSAARLNVELAALLAVAEVESAGKAFARVNGKNEPVIRWEGHYFDRRLSGSKRAAARKAGLASPTVGGVPNPSKQDDRWKLLNRAIELDARAAMESASYGVGQVMGANWKDLGYPSVAAMVNVLRESVAGQIEVMGKFIEKNKLAVSLRRKDWAAFAKGYNGTGYAKNQYDKKMATAYAKWDRSLKAGKLIAPDATPTAEMSMKLGDTGPLVEELQRNLVTLDYPVTVNATFDKATKEAVEAFQALHKDDSGKALKVDGVVGLRTSKAIAAALLAPKIKQATKTVPPAAEKQVKEKTGLWGKIVAVFGGGGVGLGFLTGMDWKAVAAAGGVIVVLLLVGLVLQNQIIEAFRKINAEARQ